MWDAGAPGVFYTECGVTVLLNSASTTIRAQGISVTVDRLLGLADVWPYVQAIRGPG